MINFFKTLGKPVKGTSVAIAKKTQRELIQEIHETFFTEVDTLLRESEEMISDETTMGYLINKCERLKALGFSSSSEVKEAEIEIERLKDISKINNEKKIINEAIKYFSIKYPSYKFITKESIEKICNKYGLVYGNVDRYIGTIPDKNLEHIEKFKISDEDKCYYNTYRSSIRERDSDLISFAIYNYFRRDSHYESMSTKYEGTLKIAAPQKDFNLNQSEIKNFKIESIVKEDPVVFYPVRFENKVFYLIVTAWGDEASDELVVNYKMN
jgi:hypothetical protein